MVYTEKDQYDSIVTREKLWLCLIICIGAALRLYRLDAQSLWQDEGLQYYVASADSISAVIERTRGRTWHPPLSFVVNHLFLRAGSSDVLLRLPSVLFGIGSLPVFYLLLKRLASEQTAMFSVLLLAISPFHVWYSQEGRMYAQLVFLSLLGALIFLRAVEAAQWHWWFLYAVVVVVGMYTHVLMAFGVIANIIWLVLYHPRRLLPLTASGILVSVLFLPWVYSFPMVQNFIYNTSGPRIVAGSTSSGFSWAVLPYTFFVYCSGFSLGPSVAELHENRSVAFIMDFFPLLASVGLIAGTLGVVGIWALYKYGGTKCLVFCTLGLVVSVGGAVFFSLLPRGLFNVRYAIAGFPYFCAFMGGALTFLFRKNEIVGFVAVLALTSIFGAALVNHFSNPRYAKEDIRSAVAAWNSAGRHEYLLSVAPGGVRDAINKYLPEPKRDQHISIGMQNTVPQTLGFLAKRNVSSASILLARDWHQVREKSIRNAFTVVDEQAYPGVKLLRIDLPNGEDYKGMPAYSIVAPKQNLPLRAAQ
jgi:uncharacterized membrane protein